MLMNKIVWPYELNSQQWQRQCHDSNFSVQFKLREVTIVSLVLLLSELTYKSESHIAAALFSRHIHLFLDCGILFSFLGQGSTSTKDDVNLWNQIQACWHRLFNKSMPHSASPFMQLTHLTRSKIVMHARYIEH